MTVQYENGRALLNNEDWEVQVSPGGNLSATTLYFGIQGRNRIGKNLIKVSELIQIQQGSKIEIKIKNSAKQTGEGWREYVISVSPLNDLTTFEQICSILNFDVVSGMPLTYPLIIELTNDYELIAGEIYPDVVAVPALKNGATIGLSSNNLFYEFRKNASYNILNSNLAVALQGGVLYPTNTTNSNIENTGGDGGAAQDVNTIGLSERIEIPRYEARGTISEAVILWLTNDTGSIISQGTKIDVAINLSNLPKNRFFDGKIILEILGYVNKNTGVLRNTKESGENFGDTPIAYQFGKQILKLADNLGINEVVAIRCQLNFFGGGGLLPEGSIVSILPFFDNAIGTYLDLGDFFGEGAILPTGGLRRISPGGGLSVIVKSGSGFVKNFLFPELRETIIPGLAVNTDNQRILINSNGACYRSLIPTGGLEPSDSVLRCLVGTAARKSPVSLPQNLSISANSNLTITIIYPTNISSSYPDVIAGQNAIFEASSIEVLIVPSPVTGLYYSIIQPAFINTPSQTIAITSLPVASQLTSIDAPDLGADPNSLMATGNYGLYVPNIPTAVIGVGAIPPGTYKVYVRYIYDGNTITRIDHRINSGCILELTRTLSQIAIDSSFWLSVQTPTSVRQLNSSLIPDGAELKIILNNEKSSFLYEKRSVVPDDNSTTFKPNDIAPESPGRFRLITSIVPPLSEDDLFAQLLIFT